MAKIFLSYRRQDSAAMAGRIYDRLRAHFGSDAVFMDVDNIPFGVNFRKHIDAAVGQCDVVLAVIGTKWAGETEVHRRLDDHRDFVRIELESALKREIPLIPILVDHAKLPGEAELPPSLALLADYNALDVDHGRDFHHHVDLLIRGIEFHLQQKTIPAAGLSSPAQDAAPTLPAVQKPEWPQIVTATEDERQSIPSPSVETRADSAASKSGSDVLTKGHLDSAPAASETGPTRSAMADDDPKRLQRPGAVRHSAELQGGNSYAPTGVQESVVWRNRRLTWILGTLHLFFGGLVFSVCVTIALLTLLLPRSPSVSQDNNQKVLALVVVGSCVAMLPATIQIVGGYGFWRRKRWSTWLSSVGAGLLSLLGVLVLVYLAVGVDIRAALLPGPFAFCYIALLSFHLWLRPKIVPRGSASVEIFAEKHPEPRF
jgi:hypothetical protein